MQPETSISEQQPKTTPGISYEYSLLKLIMSAFVISGMVAIPSNYLSGLSFKLNLAVGLMTTFNICLLWLSRDPGRFQQIRWISLTGNSAFLSAIWFLNGGLLGSIPSFSYCFNIAFICVCDGFHYQLLSGLLALLCCNIMIELAFPGIVTSYPNHETQFGDVALAVVEGNFLFGLLAIQIKLRLQSALKALGEKNQELEATLADLKDSQNREREHLQLICHDLRNPVSAILSCTDLSADQIAQLPQGNPAVEELRDTVRTIELCSNRSLQLIEMLSLAQFLEQGATRADTQFDLRHSLSQSIEVAVAQARQKQQTLRFSLGSSSEDDNGYSYYGSQPLLELLWQNLLDNAIKYSPRCSEIQILLEVHSNLSGPEKSAPCYYVRIVDKGQGISPVEIPALFKKFGRASSVPTDGESSTGLGLYICKKIAELHGGEIHASSAGQNQGTTISVKLPFRTGST